MPYPDTALPRLIKRPITQSRSALNGHDKAWKIPADLRAYARVKSRRNGGVSVNPFLPASPPLGVPQQLALAQDKAIASIAQWANDQAIDLTQTSSSVDAASSFAEGTVFLGYAYLSQLAQRPEYRRITEVIANEMTRKWLKLQAKGDDDKTDKIDAIETEFKRLKLQDAFRAVAMQDGFFGRGHLYIDLGTGDDREELKTTIGSGDGLISRVKITKGSLKAVRPVEPVWCYPTSYDSVDPLKEDWYNPTEWFVMGKQVHATRLLKFVSREVPDVLKPAYSFGGLSMTQMAKPYVDNWLRTRQSVADMLHGFSVFALATDMQAALAAGASSLIDRIQLFNDLRDNKGLMALNKESEDIKNISAPLGSLDSLQAQSQEQMASVSGLPLVKLTGISPHGLNASSEGEIRVFYDWISSLQALLFNHNLQKILCFVQLNLWGEIDPDISFVWEPLWALDEATQANIRKTEAETGQALIDGGVISQLEERRRVASDPDTRYPGLDVEELPQLKEEEEQGLEPPGGRPGLLEQEQKKLEQPGLPRQQQPDGDDEPGAVPELVAGGATDIFPFGLTRVPPPHSGDSAGGQFASFALDDFEESEHPREVKGSSKGGQFTKKAGGGGVAGEEKLNQKVIDVGGSDWNRQIAVRLEWEWIKAKPNIEHLVSEMPESAKTSLAGDWKHLSYHVQGLVEDDYKNSMHDAEYDYQFQDWKENIAPDQIADDIVNKYNSRDDDSWVHDSLFEWMKERESEGTPVPYEIDQLQDAVFLNYVNGKLLVSFDNSKLEHPIGYTSSQPTLPGIEPEDPSRKLTAEMRDEIDVILGERFKQELEIQLDDASAPDYLEENVQESLNDSWNDMEDSEKFNWASKYYPEFISEEEGGKQKLAVPDRWDPLNETTGTGYRRTQVVAKYVSEQRATDIIIERGLVKRSQENPDKFRAKMVELVTKADKQLWGGWIESSTSYEGKILQLATAEELGGRLRVGQHLIDRDRLIAKTDMAFAEVGGFAGVKALVRAKWEMTQYMLEQAGQDIVHAYRAVSIPTAAWTKTVGDHVLLPDLHIERNGCASMTTDENVANDWDGSANRIVLRASLPRTAVVSVPAYGQNLTTEHEIVVAGTAWIGWDAWMYKAPKFAHIDLQGGEAGMAEAA